MKKKKDKVSLLDLTRKWASFLKFIQKRGGNFPAYTNERGERVEKLSDQSRLDLIHLYQSYQQRRSSIKAEEWSQEDYQDWNLLMDLIRAENPADAEELESFWELATKLQQKSDFRIFDFASYVGHWYQGYKSIEGRVSNGEAEKLAIQKQKADFSQQMLSMLIALKEGKKSFELGDFTNAVLGKYLILIDVEWLPEKTRLELMYLFFHNVKIGGL